MTNQNFEDAGSPGWEDQTQRNKTMRDAAGEAFSKASDTARDAGEKAKRAAADAASSMSRSHDGPPERSAWRWRTVSKPFCELDEGGSRRPRS